MPLTAITAPAELAAAGGAPDVRARIALVLGGTGLVLAALAIEPPLGGFAIDEPFALPPLFLGVVLALAAAAAAVAAADRDAARGPLLVATLALAALALVATIGAAERLESRAPGVGAVVTTMLALVVGGSGLVARRTPLALAGGVLVAAGLSGFVDRPAGGVVGWLLAVAGALLALLALLAVVRDHRAPANSFGDAARATAAAVELRRAAALAFAGIAALTFFGALYDTGAISIGTFDLNAEQTVGVVFSSALLLVAALLAWLLAGADASARATWLTLAVVFGILAIDELIVFHEELQERTDVKGQLFLAPLAIAGAVAWFRAIQRTGRDSTAARLLVAGAIGWALSQLLDVLQDPEADEFMWTVVPEEACEMVGSALFALGLLAALKAARRALPR